LIERGLSFAKTKATTEYQPYMTVFFSFDVFIGQQ